MARYSKCKYLIDNKKYYLLVNRIDIQKDYYVINDSIILYCEFLFDVIKQYISSTDFKFGIIQTFYPDVYVPIYIENVVVDPPHNTSKLILFSENSSGKIIIRLIPIKATNLNSSLILVYIDDIKDNCYQLFNGT